MGGRIRQIAHAIGKRATDALSHAIDTQEFLGRAIELQNVLTDLAVSDAMPDPMAGEAAIALVDERTLEALLLLGLRKTLEHVLRIIGMYWEDQPSTQQQRQ
jgi:hypothetical protein